MKYFLLLSAFFFGSFKAYSQKEKTKKDELIVFVNETISSIDFNKQIAEVYKKQFRTERKLTVINSYHTKNLFLVKGENVSKLILPNPQYISCKNVILPPRKVIKPPTDDIECQPCPGDTLQNNVTAYFALNQLPKNLINGACVRNCCCPRQSTYFHLFSEYSKFEIFEAFGEAIKFKNLKTIICDSKIVINNCPVFDKFFNESDKQKIAIIVL